MLVNARISDRSFNRYRMFRPFIRRVLENVDWVSAQTEKDAERFATLGARPERVRVTGNLKFDVDPPRAAVAACLRRALADARRSPVMVAASTMQGEEPLLLETWEAVRRRHPGAVLILAPRHPARFDSVAKLLDDHDRSFVRRTDLNLGDDGLTARVTLPEILLLDTIGELASIFELADLVFMGGSLVPSGGHNLLEPAFWGKPVLCGPHMENFQDIAQLFKAGSAVVQVRDPSDLTREVLDLFEDDQRRRKLGENAKRVLAQSSGATRRVAEHIQELLEAEVPIRAGV
jgi:3-deoxy-D-manno-octulosonic-acid transferase